jgi:energy-coupling factor transporter ATP-binding protein EcfA2
MGVEIDLSRGCTVVAGRNGAGKSRLLAAAKTELADKGVLIQLHQICERIRAVHASRNDIPEMEEETGPLTLNADMTNHVYRIVGREYEDIQWFALDLEPSDEDNSVFLWSSDQSLVPHFRATYREIEYTTLEMGLGELSVHVLFWVLEQYRDVEGVTLLLDEPDAYLPPIGSERMLARVQDVCLHRKWDLVVSTHSEEMIRTASVNDGLLLLRLGDHSAVESARSWVDGPEIAAELLSEPPVDLILFCEDESAAALTRSLLRAEAEDHGRSTTVFWKDGAGYLTALSQHLPRYPQMKVKFGLVFDGDQRGRDGKDPLSTSWQSIFLPTSQDPDELFKSLAADPGRLATRLQTDEAKVVAWLDALEGSDSHDWVNGLGDRHGTRVAVLDALADLWVADHPEECKTFNEDVATTRLF